MYHARPDVMKKEITTASDMWMFGQTALHLWTHSPPVLNPTPIPDEMPLRDLIRQCLAEDPAQRPTAREAFLEVHHSLRLGVPLSPSPKRRGSIAPLSDDEGQALPSPKMQQRRMSTSDVGGYALGGSPGGRGVMLASPWSDHHCLESKSPDGTVCERLLLDDLAGGGVPPPGRMHPPTWNEWQSGWAPVWQLDAAGGRLW